MKPPLYDATDEAPDTGKESPYAKVLARLDEIEGKILAEIVGALAPSRELRLAVEALEGQLIRLSGEVVSLSVRLDRIDGGSPHGKKPGPL